MFKFKIRLLIPIVLVCLLASWTKDRETIQKSAGKIKTLKSIFVQKKYIKNILKKPITSSGHLYFNSPDSLRWEYTKPYSLKSILLVNKKSINKFIYKNGKFIESSSGGAQSMQLVFNEILNWLKGDFEKSNNFRIRLVQKPSPIIILNPISDKLKRVISRIELYPSRKPGVIKKIRIIENKNSYTIIKFNSIRINSNINDKVFQVPN